MEFEYNISENKHAEEKADCNEINSNEEKKSATQIMNEMYWKQMDNMLEVYKQQNPEKFELAQKKGEEIMSFDYKNPEEFVKKRDMREYGKKVYKDVIYNCLSKEELTTYDLECLEEYTRYESISFSFDDINKE